MRACGREYVRACVQRSVVGGGGGGEAGVGGGGVDGTATEGRASGGGMRVWMCMCAEGQGARGGLWSAIVPAIVWEWSGNGTGWDVACWRHHR